jgi:hypothetical protein
MVDGYNSSMVKGVCRHSIIVDEPNRNYRMINSVTEHTNICYEILDVHRDYYMALQQTLQI